MTHPATDLPPSDLTQKDEKVAVIGACVEVPRGLGYGELHFVQSLLSRTNHGICDPMVASTPGDVPAR